MNGGFEKYTPREKEIARLLEDGNSHKMIAGNLRISVHTVRTIMHRIYTKAQVHSVAQFLKYMHAHPEHFNVARNEVEEIFLT